MRKRPADHRKRLQRSDEQGQGHELTFSCYQGRPLLDDDRRCQHLATAVDRAVGRHGFSLLAFVFMPNHVHLLVFPEGPSARISDLLYAIKRPVSFRIKRDLMATKEPLLERLVIRERPGKMTFRFWQEGPGYDRNVLGSRALRTMINYLHMNPVRCGLVDHPRQWKWSSWRYYAGEPNTPGVELPTIKALI